MTNDSREKFFSQLLVDYVLMNEILAGAYSEQCLQKIGIKYGLRYEDGYRAEKELQGNLSAHQFAELSLAMLNGLGGKYSIQACADDKLVLLSYGCPFGHMALKSPVLCEVLLGAVGGIAARNFAYSKVCMQHSIAMKATTCQLIVFLEETFLAEQTEGRIFTDNPTAYLLTRQEIHLLGDELASRNHIYNKYVKSFENLKSIHRELECEYNQLRNEIFSDLKLGVLTINGAGKITYINRIAQELLQVECHWDSQVTKSLQKLLDETLKSKQRFNQHLAHMPFPEGFRYYSVNTAPLLDEAGSATGAVCVFQDVTGKKMLENELIQMEKFSLIAELAAGTAHEIRNPMTTLRGFLQILTREFKPDTKGFEYCSLMIEEIDRANAIIKEFLLLTKPAAPKLKESDLHVILEEIFLLIESKSLLENVELHKRYTKRLPLVKVDSSQIKQVFLNLATNAIQAMPAGGRLTIATMADSGNAIVQFSDTGCGMDELQLLKIFDPFFTTKEQGTGLGLTISYRIIENHGGRLYADSIPGKGTAFTVELPAISED